MTDLETSMVNMSFSRYDKNDNVILTASADFFVMNDDGIWRIKGGFAPTNVSNGKD